MKIKPFASKPSWATSFGKKPRTYCRSQTKIIANPGFIIKLRRHKKIIIFLVYLVLVAVTILNFATYKWTSEPKTLSLQVKDGVNFNRSNLHSLHTGTQGRKRQLIFVSTTWRSGLSFFGELFNQNPGVFYLDEPMWHIWQKLYPGDALSLQGAARDMLSALYRCDFSVFQLYNLYPERNLTTLGIFGAPVNKVICSYPLCSFYRKDVVGMVDEKVCNKCPPQSLQALEEQCLKYDTVVIKGVRISDLNVLAPLLEDPSLNLKVVHLVRDPRAIASSRIQSKYALIREKLQLMQRMMQHANEADPNHKSNSPDSKYNAIGALEAICEHMSNTLKTVVSNHSWLRGKYMMVRYEDLVENPVGTLKRVYQFVNLTVSHDIEAFAVYLTSGHGNFSEFFQVSNWNATMTVNAWRTVLTLQQNWKVEDLCEYAMYVLGYVLVHTLQELKDLSKSLLTVPKV